MQDLSSLADGSLTFDSSMHAGNTISVRPPFTPEGSESEATQSIETHSRPEPDLGPNNDHQLNTKMNDTGAFSTHALSWKMVK